MANILLPKSSFNDKTALAKLIFDLFNVNTFSTLNNIPKVSQCLPASVPEHALLLFTNKLSTPIQYEIKIMTGTYNIFVAAGAAQGHTLSLRMTGL